jgi:para-nitrobenzyl esterase
MTTRRLFAAAGLTVALLGSASFGLAADALPVIHLHQGAVSGVQTGDVTTFRAIPFAAPPVGELRWRAPQPAASWKGVKDGSKASAECGKAEDCLYLNVHMPAGAKPGDKLPVMVWIHGGSFTGGSGAGYDGSTYAKRGIVVVTVNYRLGRMGFFAHPALTKAAGKDAVGNYGIMDQIAALKWVKSNVATFGGDPAKVTVAGESAGASSVYFLMTSPQARGLFVRAISESGFPRYDSETLAQAEQSGVKASKIKGDDAKALAALRALPMNAIGNGDGLYDLGRPRPLIDGKVIVKWLPEAFAKGEETKVPFLMGGNSNEASLLPTTNAPARIAAANNKNVVLAAWPGAPMKTANAMVTAQQVLEPNRNAARQHIRNGAPVWFFYFSYMTPAARAAGVGASHAGELRYASASLPATATAEDQATAQSMNAYFASFIKYGDPGAAGGPQWPQFKAGDERYLEFGVKGPAAGKDLQKAGLDWAEADLKGSPVVIRANF